MASYQERRRSWIKAHADGSPSSVVSSPLTKLHSVLNIHAYACRVFCWTYQWSDWYEVSHQHPLEDNTWIHGFSAQVATKVLLVKKGIRPQSPVDVRPLHITSRPTSKVSHVHSLGQPAFVMGQHSSWICMVALWLTIMRYYEGHAAFRRSPTNKQFSGNVKLGSQNKTFNVAIWFVQTVYVWQRGKVRMIRKAPHIWCSIIGLNMCVCLHIHMYLCAIFLTASGPSWNAYVYICFSLQMETYYSCSIERYQFSVWKGPHALILCMFAALQLADACQDEHIVVPLGTCLCPDPRVCVKPQVPQHQKSILVRCGAKVIPYVGVRRLTVSLGTLSFPYKPSHLP